MTTACVRRSLTLLGIALLAVPLQAETKKVPQQFETIQAAVNDAAEGDTVLVSKGVYREHVSISTAGIVLKGKSGAVIDATYTGHCVVVDAADVEVTGLTLVNGGFGQADELTSDGPVAGGLRYTGAGAKISKLEVRACEGFGILLLGTGLVEKCTVDGCPGAGIDVETSNSLSETVTTISKCKISRCGEGIVATEGPFLIEKNDCDRCGSYGIFVEIQSIFVDAPPPITASVISGNDCTNAYFYAMSVADGTGAGMLVEKNTASSSSIGLRVQGFDLELSSNTIEDNSILGALLLSSDCTFSGNKVRGNAGLGVDVIAGGTVLDGVVSDGSNHVMDNVIQDNGGDGIHVESNNNEIHGNVVKDNLGDGIQLVGGGVTGNSVEANTVTGNGHDGIDNWGALTLIADNVSKGNGGADLAGVGDGGGSAAVNSIDNVVGDDSDLQTVQELDMQSVIL